MERKIGEIFEYNGEWYQCVESDSCGECSLFTTECGSGTKSDLADKVFGQCSKVRRSDNKHVIFKKLEKVGEPYEYYVSKKGIIQVQDYLLADPNHTVYNKIEGVYDYLDGKVVIEIKQNKEDMEEKNNAKHSNSEKIGKNLKEFDLEAAKSGKPVCTRDGRKARIICFDKEKDVYPLIVLVSDKDGYEIINLYKANGAHPTIPDNDLMMLPEKKEGWVNVYKKEQNRYVKGIFPSREIALNSISKKSREYIATIKITWEE